MKRRQWLVGMTVAAAAVSFGTSGFAAEPAAAGSGADAVIRKTVDGAFAVLKDKSLQGKEKRAQRIAALRKIADQVFDWAEIARSSLGASWRNLNAQQRTRYVEVFKDILAAQYMDDIDRFRGTETVTVDGSKPQGEDTLVNTTLTTSSRDRVPIDYRMRNQKGEWKVVDLSIEGVSLVNHFRKSFSSQLVNINIDQLIDKLKRQLPK